MKFRVQLERTACPPPGRGAGLWLEEQRCQNHRRLKPRLRSLRLVVLVYAHGRGGGLLDKTSDSQTALRKAARWLADILGIEMRVHIQRPNRSHTVQYSGV